MVGCLGNICCGPAGGGLPHEDVSEMQVLRLLDLQNVQMWAGADGNQ